MPGHAPAQSGRAGSVSCGLSLRLNDGAVCVVVGQPMRSPARDAATAEDSSLSVLPVPIPPPVERSLAYSKQFRRLHLAQFRPLRPAKHIRETHPTYPLVNACPIHPNLHPRRPDFTGYFTSYKRRTFHQLATHDGHGA